MKRIKSLIFLVSFFCIFEASSQVSVGKKASGTLDFNYYKDTREFNQFTLNILANLKNRFQYFSLLNTQSESRSSDKTDHTGFYTEQNLRLRVEENGFVFLSAQGVMQSGQRNDLARVGVLIDIGSIKVLKQFFEDNQIQLGINIFPLQVDYLEGHNWQVEYFYNINIAPMTFSKRLYLSGFADQNLSADKTTWVTEHQLGFRLVDNLFAITEYRINEYQNAMTGWGFGLEYVVPF